MEIKYKFETAMIVSGLFMLLTMYELPVASYFQKQDPKLKFFGEARNKIYKNPINNNYSCGCNSEQSPKYCGCTSDVPYKSHGCDSAVLRCFQGIAVQLLAPLIFQTLIPTYNDGYGNDGSALFWILDIVEYLMYFTTIYLVKRVIMLLYLPR